MKDIKKFLAELSKEMQRGEDFDIDARQVLDELHKDAAKIEESGNSHIQPMLDRLGELETRFATKHPGLERAARELADALAKMGI
ncbi:MAG: DUF4404 family protein [Woeseiaceae bacterium]